MGKVILIIKASCRIEAEKNTFGMQQSIGMPVRTLLPNFDSKWTSEESTLRKQSPAMDWVTLQCKMAIDSSFSLKERDST